MLGCHRRRSLAPRSLARQGRTDPYAYVISSSCCRRYRLIHPRRIATASWELLEAMDEDLALARASTIAGDVERFPRTPLSRVRRLLPPPAVPLGEGRTRACIQYGASPMRVFRRTDVAAAHACIHTRGCRPLTLEIRRIDLSSSTASISCCSTSKSKTTTPRSRRRRNCSTASAQISRRVRRAQRCIRWRRWSGSRPDGRFLAPVRLAGPRQVSRVRASQHFAALSQRTRRRSRAAGAQ